ncbi:MULTISPECIES: ChaN family lipoprotein [Vibrio]|uniref:Haem-binding uptake Tiki superfamily ChaN domain-containing protein n=1 Tax=Vibrio casei TaxID=673372 RepID=A0A368LP13_9VIBR|nr:MULTISPECIES: ChaN family lipoprotein [Vibrio]RCS73578.1 hypothetical protein CIK83_08130 [Vibrio casei]SJN31022.1 Uncharacterized iron-regulated protein [Vibrio casei]HBV76308.1 hypothetical protein [Vibrio sp.]
MTKKQLLSTLSIGFAALGLLSGCSSPANPKSTNAIDTFYDFQLHAPSGQAMPVSQFLEQVKSVDVILVGEWHTHAGVHHFQTQLLKQFIKHKHNIALSMEQFSRDKQSIVDQYLHGEIGEQTLITQGNAWPNYESDYRPLIEVAKTHNVDVIASNAPKIMVQCIAREGLQYLDSLDKDQRQLVAKTIFTGESAYKQKFMASMHHGTEQQNEQQYAAQVTWDETMAESIVNYLKANPTKQVMHIAGMFHTEGGLGTASAILKLNPNLTIAVITPTETITENSPDYQLKVIAPPARYVQKNHRLEAYKALGKRKNTIDCDSLTPIKVQ